MKPSKHLTFAVALIVALLIAPFAFSKSEPVKHKAWTGYQNSVKQVYAEVTRENLGRGTATNASSRTFVRKIGCEQDDAGHLIGKALGGRAVRTNLFPQSPTWNRGKFKTFEKQIISAVKRYGKVEIYVTLKYTGSEIRTRPTSIRYRVIAVDQTTGTKKRIFDMPFPNPFPKKGCMHDGQKISMIDSQWWPLAPPRAVHSLDCRSLNSEHQFIPCAFDTTVRHAAVSALESTRSWRLAKCLEVAKAHRSPGPSLKDKKTPATWLG